MCGFKLIIPAIGLKRIFYEVLKGSIAASGAPKGGG